MTPHKDWDIKITQGATSHRFRLLQQRGQKAWQVSESPPNPRVETEASSREGFRPDRELPFVMEDWTWGFGLERFGSQSVARGHLLRYADGFNIDTTRPDIVQHGPLEEAVGGSLSSGQHPLDFALFQDKVYFITNKELYAIESGSSVLKNTATEIINSMAVFNDKLYISTSEAGKYLEWDGSSMVVKSVADGALLFEVHTGIDGPVLVRVINDNFISTASDPNDVSSWDSTGIKVGEGDSITSMFVISGFLFCATQSGIYVIATDTDGVSTPIELSRLLTTRRSTDTYRIKAESGSDVWLTDTRDIIRIVAERFDQFDIRFNGPFRSFDERPVTLDLKGKILALAQTNDAIYVAALRGSDTYIYKGVEILRGVYSWCPWAKFTETDVRAMAVIKTTGDSDPILYIGKNEALIKFTTENWTKFAATWELITPQFTATLETWDKMWRSIEAFIVKTGDAKLEIAYRLNNDTDFIDFDDSGAGDNDMTADGFNELILAAPINGKKIQLRLTGSNVLNTEKVDLRSFNLKGLLRPDREPIFDFTIIADNTTEVTFINALRTDVTQFFVITDRFGTDRTAFMLSGFPIEQEQTDEAIKESVRTYRIVAQEVL